MCVVFRYSNVHAARGRIACVRHALRPLPRQSKELQNCIEGTEIELSYRLQCETYLLVVCLQQRVAELRGTLVNSNITFIRDCEQGPECAPVLAWLPAADVIEVGGWRIGIFGVCTTTAVSNAHKRGIVFEPVLPRAHAVVEQLRKYVIHSFTVLQSVAWHLYCRSKSSLLYLLNLLLVLCTPFFAAWRRWMPL